MRYLQQSTSHLMACSAARQLLLGHEIDMPEFRGSGTTASPKLSSPGRPSTMRRSPGLPSRMNASLRLGGGDSLSTLYT